MSAIITALPTSRSIVAPGARRGGPIRVSDQPLRAVHPATYRARHTAVRPTAHRRPSVGVMALIAIVVAAAVALGGLFGARAAADAVSPGRAAAPLYVIAEPGDTLWSIAARIAPHASITEVVDQLVVLNGTSITAGQAVRVP
jgi:hypothetical protein